MRRIATRRGAILTAVCLGQFLLQLDLTVVNVALPSIGAGLHASVPALQWVVDGYNLAVAGLLLAAGRVGDRTGHARVYLVGLAVFGAASALCAAAPGAGVLIGFRVLQGAGAAIELPATLAILTATFTDPRERAQAVGVWTASAGTALVVGPTLGGALVQAAGWRAVFAVNVPVVAAVLALSLLVLAWRRGGGTQSAAGSGQISAEAPQTSGAPARLDLPGQALGAATLVLLAAAAIEAGRGGAANPGTLALAAAGILAAALFVRAERRSTDPLLPPAYFRDRTYTAANLAALVMGFVTIGLLFLLSLFLQHAQGLSALASGLGLLPLTVAFVATGPLIGRALERTGPLAPIAVGAALQAAGALALLRAGAGDGYGPVWWPLAVIGVGYGLMSTPMAAAVLAAVPPGRAGMASSTNLTARLVGGVFGVAVLGSLLPDLTAAAPAAVADGVHAALVVAAAVALAGAVAVGAVAVTARRRGPAVAAHGRRGRGKVTPG